MRIINPDLSAQQLIEKTFGRSVPSASPPTLLEIFKKFLGITIEPPPKVISVTQAPEPRPEPEPPTSAIERSFSSRSIEDLIKDNQTFEIQEEIILAPVASQIETGPTIGAVVETAAPVALVLRSNILPPVFEDTREIDQLFNQAYSEVAFLEKEYLSVEFEFSQLRKFEVSEEAKLLFALAYDSFVDSTVEVQQYAEPSAVKELLSTDLEQTLAEASKAVPEIKPRASARIREEAALPVPQTSSSDVPAAEDNFVGAPLDLQMQILALAVDVVCVLAITLTVAANFYLSDELMQRLLRFDFRGDAVYFALLGGYLLEIIGPVAVLYYVVFLASLGASLGSRISRLSSIKLAKKY